MAEANRPKPDAWSDELFGDDESIGASPEPSEPAKPFSQYLRETPAAPVDSTTRWLLWIAGVATAILFLASLLKVAG